MSSTRILSIFFFLMLSIFINFCIFSTLLQVFVDRMNVGDIISRSQSRESTCYGLVSGPSWVVVGWGPVIIWCRVKHKVGLNC